MRSGRALCIKKDFRSTGQLLGMSFTQEPSCLGSALHGEPALGPGTKGAFSLNASKKSRETKL